MNSDMLIKGLIFSLLFLALFVPGGVFAEDADIIWPGPTPSEIHEELARGKAQALTDKRIARSLAASPGEANTQTNYDVRIYDIDIRVDDTTEILYGAVRFRADAVAEVVNEVQVDLHSGMDADSIIAPSGALYFARSADVVTVSLDRSYNAGERFEFEVFYHGHPTEGGFQGFAFDMRLNKKVISSLSEPFFARTWWPCKDRMDDKADSFHIAITVDQGFYVASNGSLDSTIDFGGGAHTFYYTEHYPMASYLFSVAIADYRVWYDEWLYNDGADTMPLVHAVFDDRYVYSLSKYDMTPYALDVLSEQYGLYPFADEKYGHVNFVWGGGMEHQTMTSMSGADFGFDEATVVHELAHQWWGDMITCETWGDIWLNEGWAVYSEALYFLEKQGWQYYHWYMNNIAYPGSGTVYVEDTTSASLIFYKGLTYHKAAWVVHMLRGVLGDSLFFEGVRAYYDSPYKFASATTDDFRSVFEQATGWELDWFFEDWIYGEFRPNYQYRYFQEASDSGGFDVFFITEQVQTTSPQVFRMPVDFFFDFTSIPDDTVRLWPDERYRLFKFNLPSTIDDIQCDPADWVLKYESRQPWELHLISFDAEISDGLQYLTYNDTVEARGGSGNLNFSIAAGSLPYGYDLRSNGVIYGSTRDTGLFVFTVRVDDNLSSFYDEAEYSIYLGASELVPGDIDLNSSVVDVADVSYLAEYIFVGGPDLPAPNAADVDGSCQVNVGDLVYLVDFMFRGGAAPRAGCVD